MFFGFRIQISLDLLVQGLGSSTLVRSFGSCKTSGHGIRLARGPWGSGSGSL